MTISSAALTRRIHSIYLGEDRKNRLQAYAQSHGITLSEVLRRAADAMMQDADAPVSREGHDDLSTDSDFDFDSDPE